jgi:hypothetical protein
MWIEIAGEMINFDLVLKVVKLETDGKHSIRLYFTKETFWDYSFSSDEEVEMAYFNILESIRSKPVDGFRE